MARPDRTDLRRDPQVWFEPKLYGYGAGLPVAWEGWALLAGYSAVLLAVGVLLMPRHPLVSGAVVVTATAALLLIAAAHTRGGWRWRWGSGDD